jgi:hypothetical protein
VSPARHVGRGGQKTTAGDLSAHRRLRVRTAASGRGARPSGFPNWPIVQYDQQMHRKSLQLVLVAVFVLTFAAACGGSGGTKNSTATHATTTPAKLPFKATFYAPTHHPVVKKNWPITVTVTDLSGKSIAATLQMNVLFGGARVGRIDNGKIYHFVGRHHENITWPKRSVGYPLTVQAVVKAKGKTKKLSWTISVMSK